MEDVDFFACGRLARNSQIAYTTYWGQFKRFCDERGVCPLPADMQTIADFLVEHSETQKVATLQQALSAIRNAHRIRKALYPVNSADAARYTLDMEHPIFADPWAVIRREKGTRPVQKMALTWPMLLQIIPQMPDTFYGYRDKAMLLTCFGAALRRSELVALDYEDLTFSTQGVSLLIRRSKTDQAAQGRVKRIPRNPQGLCGVAYLEAWLAYAGIVSGPLFITDARTRFDAIHYPRIVKRAVALIGKDPKLFSGHSLRRGFVTTAFENGATAESIRDKTFHSSIDMVLRYRESAQVFDSPADKAVFGL